MSTPEQTYRKLSDAVEAMRVGHQAARKRAAANEKLPALARAAGRSEYIRELLALQATGQAVLDSTSERDEREMHETRFGRQRAAVPIVTTLGLRSGK